MKSIRSWVVFLGLVSVSSLFGSPVARAGSPAFKKTMIVVFENTNYQAALNQPTFAKFARDGALLTNLVSEVHPSEGNYIALVAGSNFGIANDSSVTLDVQHIGDLLEAHGKSWKIYLEGYPGNCFTGMTAGKYVRRHNPFISFKNVQSNPVRCKAHLVPATALAQDIQAGKVPDFSLYIPDVNNDGHDTGVAFADRWFSRVFGPLLQNSSFMQNLLLVATFDESAASGGNHIYGAFFGDSVVPGSQNTASLTHFSILRLVERQLGLESLNRSDASAPLITGIWK